MIISYTLWRRPVNVSRRGRNSFEPVEQTLADTWQQGQRVHYRCVAPDIMRDYNHLVRLFAADNSRRRANDL